MDRYDGGGKTPSTSTVIALSSHGHINGKETESTDQINSERTAKRCPMARAGYKKKPRKTQKKTKKNKEKQRKTKKTNIIRYSPLPSMFLSVKLEKKLIKKSWRRPEKVRHVYRFQWSNSAPPSAILQGRSKDPRARSQKKNTEPRTWRQEHGPKNR